MSRGTLPRDLSFSNAARRVASPVSLKTALGAADCGKRRHAVGDFMHELSAAQNFRRAGGDRYRRRGVGVDRSAERQRVARARRIFGRLNRRDAGAWSGSDEVTRPHAENLVGEFPPTKGFRQKTFERREARHGVFFGGKIVAGYHHKGRFRHERGGLADELKAVELRHIIVCDDDAGIQRGQSFDRFERTRKSMDGAVEVFGEHLREQVRVGLFVINEHDGSGRGRVHGCGGRDGGACRRERQSGRRART